MDQTVCPEERAALLLRELSLDEKMAQINGIFPFDGIQYDYEELSRQTRWGIGTVSTLEMRRIETLEGAAAWQRTVQKIIMENSPHHIPAIFHMEGLCGAFIQEATSFPAGIGRGAGWNPSLEERIGAIVSHQEASCGITHVLAPVLDISRDARMGRQGETYGEDPTLAAALGAAYTKGVQNTVTAGRKPDSVAKHFLAFHNSQGGIHGTHSDTPPRLMREIYGKPFQASIQSGLQGVMPCYCSIDGEPLSASKTMLTTLLRQEMGFEGLCMSDYGAVGNTHSVHHIGESYGEAGARCLEAGMDMELPSCTGYGAELRQMLVQGEVDVALLDRAVLRVLTAKFRMGLFEHPYALEGETLKKTFCGTDDYAVTLQSAKESLVLLKNKGVLPLSGSVKKIALIGPHADSPRKFFGGYTHMCMMESTYAVANSIAGVNGSIKAPGVCRTVPGTQIQMDEGPEFDAILRRQKPNCPSLLTELRRRLPNTEIQYAYGYHIAGADTTGFGEALQKAAEADVVILTLGGKHGTCSMASMGEGVDAANINLPACQDAFLAEVAKLRKPLIGIHFDGRPISSDMADRHLDAILEAWSPAEAGAEAVVRALLGEDDPGGKLPVSVAYHAGQIPIYYNHPYGSAWHQGESIGFVNYVDLPHTPRYPFGFGLSYTEFQYHDFKVSTSELAPNQSVQILLAVTNTGKYGGDEVVQLYFSDCNASMTRPVQELAGFQRIHLDVGETKRVCFTLNMAQTAFLDRDMRWKVEKGTFELRVGSSSEDIRFAEKISVTEDAWVQGKNRPMYAKAEVLP
jgi:beta-glucosidase